MIAPPSQRIALTFAALLVAGISFNAPVAATASRPHEHLADRFVLPKAQSHEVYQVVAPRFFEAPSQADSPFAEMHQE